MSEETPTPAPEEVVIEVPIKPTQRNVERRLTVTSTVYVQIPGNEMVECSEGFTHFISTDEQPFDRVTSVGRQWTKLELGWMRELPHCSMSFINRSPERGPNLEIRLEESSVNRIIVKPTQSARFSVDDPKELWIRSSSEDVKVKFRYMIVPE